MKISERIEWERFDTLALVGMLIGAVAIFTILPYDHVFYRGDMSYYTAMEYAIRTALREGELPLWNPYFMEPLLANPESMVLYPPHLLLRFLPIRLFFPVQAILHVWLVGVALYLLLRHWDFSRLASLTSASAVAYSALVIIRIVIGHVDPVPVFAWSIFALLFYARLLHYGRFRDFLLTIIATANIYLSGHTQISIIGLMLPGSYLIYHLIQERSWKAALRDLLRTALIGIFSAGILAVHLFPVLEYLPEMTRAAGFSYELSANYSLNGIDALNVFLPYGTIETTRNTNIAHELLYYTTVLLGGLALAAFRLAPKERRPLLRYISIVALVIFLLALGRSTPLYKGIYLLFPFFRVPGRFLYLWTLPAAVWIALGFDAGQPEKKQRLLLIGLAVPVLIILAAIITASYSGLQLSQFSSLFSVIITAVMVIAAFVVLGLQSKLSNEHWQRTLAVLIIIDAAFHGAYSALWPQYLEKQPPALAVDQALECLSKQVDISDGRLYTQDITDLRAVRAGAAHGILSYQENISGNLNYTNDLITAGPVGKYLLRVSYYVPTDDTALGATQEVLGTDCGILVYKNRDVLPHVYAVNHLDVVDDDPASSLAMIQDPSFDPLKRAVISVPEGWSIPELVSDEVLQYEAEIVELKSNQIVIDVTASQDALLVLSEVYYPGWQAAVDGQPAPIYRANHGLQGVLIDQGEHRVQFHYKPASVRYGLIISLISLALLIPVGIFWRRRT